MSNIDFDFISKLEGGQRLDAYVPAGPAAGKSGVTIATGFDLGGRDAKELKALKLADALIAKLEPYLGKTGKDAEGLVKQTPLKLDKKEADLLDQIVRKNVEDTLIRAYDGAVKQRGGTAKFTDLIPEAQTVIASVQFQYQDLPGRTPKFWDLVVKMDFYGAIDELRDFKDKYGPRRNQEADRLEQGITKNKTSNQKLNAGPPPPTPKDWVKAAMGTDATRCFPLGKGWTGADYHKWGLFFGADRGGRAHAGCDLLAPKGTPVYAVADGTVIQAPYEFSTNGVEALEIDHGDFIVRYGEILKGSALVKKAGEKVTKGQMIAKSGKLKRDEMIHFEMYTGDGKGQLTDRNPKTSIKRGDGKDFQRRKDLVDPTPFLDAWVKNRPG